MVTQLPTFMGYTVDLRLKEFRKAHLDRGIEFVKFDEPKGKELLALYRAKKIAQAEARSKWEDSD